MTVKCDRERNRVVTARIVDGLPDDLLMAKMDAVEEANRQADFAAWRIQFTRGVDDRHFSQRRRRRA